MITGIEQKADPNILQNFGSASKFFYPILLPLSSFFFRAPMNTDKHGSVKKRNQCLSVSHEGYTAIIWQIPQ
ncbi:MAG: hypothetical protein DRI57_03695 [Deltaproteobacteria bacterium]|nr:MAG: hypothetical protein DRI57_03695 [Deltaproteobacteria bacterium]